MTWPIVRLGDVADIQLGKMLSPKSRTGTRPVPYLRNANVQWDRFDLDDVAAMDFDEREETKFSLRTGDVLVCEGGEPGRAAVWHGEIERCCYQKALHRLRPIRDAIDPQFLVHRLRLSAMAGEFTDEQAKTTIAHLPAIRLAELRLALPPITVQRRIAAQLTDQLAAVDQLAKRAEAMRAEATSMSGAVRASLFGGLTGPQERLGDAIAAPGAIIDGPFGSNLKGDHYQAEGVRVIRLGNIGVGEFIDVDRAYVTEDHFISLAKHAAAPGDIVVAALGDGARPAGRACLVPSELKASMVKADCFRIRPNSRLFGPYLMQYLNSPYVLETVASSSRGATRPRMTLGILKSLEVPVLSMIEQRNIAAQLDDRLATIDMMTKSIEAELEAIEPLPAALLRRAFDDEVA